MCLHVLVLHVLVSLEPRGWELVLHRHVFSTFVPGGVGTLFEDPLASPGRSDSAEEGRLLRRAGSDVCDPGELLGWVARPG